MNSRIVNTMSYIYHTGQCSAESWQLIPIRQGSQLQSEVPSFIFNPGFRDDLVQEVHPGRCLRCSALGLLDAVARFPGSRLGSGLFRALQRGRAEVKRLFHFSLNTSLGSTCKCYFSGKIKIVPITFSHKLICLANVQSLDLSARTEVEGANRN